MQQRKKKRHINFRRSKEKNNFISTSNKAKRKTASYKFKTQQRDIQRLINHNLQQRDELKSYIKKEVIFTRKKTFSKKFMINLPILMVYPRFLCPQLS